MEEFIVFKRFRNQQEAAATIQILQNNHVLYEYDGFTDDRYFQIEIGAASSKGCFIKILPSSFEKARKLLLNEAQNAIKDIPEDYYLYAFSAKELVEVIQKPQDWSELDYELAKYLLAEQGIEISAEQEYDILVQRDKERTTPISASWQMIVIGFLLIPLLYGAVIGWEIATAEKVLSNGQKIPVYNEQSRIIGKVLVAAPLLIIFVSIFMMVIESR